MTAKNKAMALIAEYQMILMAEDTDCGCEVLCTAIAKKSALIAVNEINKSFIQQLGLNYELTPEFEYWQEVKKEINEL